MRKQRELALQILTSGIKGWEGEELNVLGDIIHVGPVILASGVDRRDRYFVLFPTTLLVLSTSTRMSSFVYEVRSNLLFCSTYNLIFPDVSSKYLTISYKLG
jgi:Rho guanine nucleotide exchange factor 7